MIWGDPAPATVMASKSSGLVSVSVGRVESQSLPVARGSLWRRPARTTVGPSKALGVRMDRDLTVSKRVAPFTRFHT